MACAGQAGAVGFRAKELRGVPEHDKRSRGAAPLTQPTERAVRGFCEVDAQIDRYTQSAGTPLRPLVKCVQLGSATVAMLVSARRTRSQHGRAKSRTDRLNAEASNDHRPSS